MSRNKVLSSLRVLNTDNDYYKDIKKSLLVQDGGNNDIRSVQSSKKSRVDVKSWSSRESSE